MRTLKALFTSELRCQLLRRVLLGGVQELHERELARRESLHLGAMRRELKSLLAVGLVLTRKAGGRRYYRANPEHPYYRDLKSLFLKAVFLGKKGRESKSIQSKIRLAFVFGSSAKGEEDAHSDLDLLVVGSISDMELGSKFRPSPGTLGRELNILLYREESLRADYKKGDSFIRQVIEGPKLFIRGSEHELRETLKE